MHKHNRPPLSGIFTPNIVPLDHKNRIDEEEYLRHLTWLLDSGVHGIYPNGSTGEFTRFSVAERRRIIALTCEVCLPRQIPILAGAAEANVEETLDACRAYHDLGATAVAIVSPIYYRLSSDSIFAYFAAIAQDSPIDVTLYNIPMLASPIDVATVRKLAERYERIIGIKDSSGDVAHMARLVNAIRPIRPDFCFLTGWDIVLLPMMVVGATGGTNATSGIVPELMRQLYDQSVAGLRGNGESLTRATALQMRLVELFDAMLSTPGLDFPEGFRTGMRLRGFKTGEGRQPLTDSQRQARHQLEDTLSCMLGDLGIPSLRDAKQCRPRPFGGNQLFPGPQLKSATSDPVSPTVVAEITAAVMASLRNRS
jgi:4-hydroxy-tetrahydrodipicolinate synthase